LYKDQVPDLHYLGVVLVNKRGPGNLFPLCLGPDIYVDFGTGTAGALLAHFPEVILLVTPEDTVFRKVRLPEFPGLMVHLELVVVCAPFEDRGIEPVFINFIYPGE